MFKVSISKIYHTTILMVTVIILASTAFGQVEYGSFVFDGYDRDYIVFLPDNFEPGLPLVFSLHGYYSSAEWQMNNTLMNQVADTANFVVVYPNAINTVWNSGINDNPDWPAPTVDDVAFISALIDTIHARYQINLNRVYSCGVSNGGLMSFRLAGDLNDRINKIASVVGIITPTIVQACSLASPISVLQMNGTADHLVPYYEGIDGWFSAVETLDFWLTHNQCNLPADSLILPDIDQNDDFTVTVFSYRGGADDTEVIFYRLENAGHVWPGIPYFFPTYPHGDINASAHIWNFFNTDSFEIHGVWATDIELSSPFMTTNVDTLIVTAPITNTDDHSYTAHVFIQSFDSTLVDSFLLYDDGEHGDGLALDGVVGSTIQTQSIESHFTVQISTMDLDADEYFGPHDLAVFTTVGPIMFDEITFITDTIAEPGDYISFQFALENLGSNGIAESITATVSSHDSCFSVLSLTGTFGDIGPGESNVIAGGGGFRISDSCPGNVDLTIVVDIYSNDYHFWTDSFNIHVYEPQVIAADNGLLPHEYSLSQNYPNPFNPVTTIQYSLPQRSDVQITIYDLLGKEVITLISETQDAGYKSIQWNASNVPSGMYFYQIKAGTYVQTKKMVLLK